MSIEQLKEDLNAVVSAVPFGPLVTPQELGAYLKDNLVPFIASAVDELEEIDSSVEDLVHQSVDVLHEETAEVFAGIITSGVVMANELLSRAGNDQRIIALVREWKKVAAQGEEILTEITIPDPLADSDDLDDEETPNPKPLEKGATE